MKTSTFIVALALAALSAVRAPAQQPPEKWFVVEDAAVNTASSFMLRVDVDQPDRTYAVGETMTVTVKPEKDCYLYLLYYSANDDVICLFPNKFQSNNFVRAATTVQVPAAGDSFQFTASPPLGTEMLQVIGTLKPVDVFAEQNLTKGRATQLSEEDLKGMVVELKKGRPHDWAEARIRIQTVEATAPGGTPPIPTPPTPTPSPPGTSGNRFAVCVGISDYQSDRVPPLQVSHLDAQRMAEALKAKCGVGDVTLLTNSQATAKAIEKAIFHDLPARSKPGDEIFIFFSCHGGRTADTNGDEADGFDEYLVPHDGVLGKPETMILDDTFARWMQELDGRKIAILLDNCYSGGSSKAIKGLGDATSSSAPLDFFDGEIRRTKDLGQTGTMVLAACQANQLAWEMPDQNGGSVLTYHVLKAMDQPAADANGDGHLSIAEVYRFIKEPVEKYVRETFAAEQNPVLVDNAGDSISLKP